MEYWNVYDRSGRWTGRTVPKGTPFGPGEYHPAMEAWIVNGRGELLIQQRSRDCEILPGIWGMTTGRMTAPPPSKEGRPLSAPEADRGETTLEGCIREIREELGIQVEAGGRSAFSAASFGRSCCGISIWCARTCPSPG